MRLIVGITGATGAIYGIRLLETLKKYDIERYLIISKWAEETIKVETGYSLDYVHSLVSKVLENNNLAAAVSSGSFLTDGMVIAPCSMKTLSAIAMGFTDNLIVRAADVTLKERRRLVLLTRETPLNSIHLENMLKVDRAGGIIMPPVPSFYTKPETVDDIVNHTIGRVLDIFRIEGHGMAKRWNG